MIILRLFFLHSYWHSDDGRRLGWNTYREIAQLLFRTFIRSVASWIMHMLLKLMLRDTGTFESVITRWKFPFYRNLKLEFPRAS